MDRILLSTNVRDENNLGEWIDYHEKLGFDGILIWDDGSVPPVRTNRPRVQIGTSTCNNKLEYMHKSVEYAKEQNYEFLIYLDADEYLYLPEKDVHSFLRKIPSNVMAIYFPWLMFGSNGLETNPTAHSCIYPFTKCAAKTNSLVKPLVRVRHLVGVKNPHVFFYDKEQTLDNTLYAPFDQMTTLSPIQPRKMRPVSSDLYFIAHYRYQSWDQFCRRKGRPRDDTKTLWKLPFSIQAKTAPPSFHKDSNYKEFLAVADAYNYLQKKNKN